ncbi:MAG: hypothetical protein Q8K75_04565 [Chlamydiales bacterium]|nr:hypothetical protein [Chlamydiales bacterium]
MKFFTYFVKNRIGISRGIDSLVLCTQRALTGYVQSNLRAVYVDEAYMEVKAFFYFDGPIDEENAEAVECVLSEIISNFSQSELEIMQFNYKPIRIDAPNPIPPEGHCVYFRYE